MGKNCTLIKQPYAVTIARHRLNVHEMRIMLRIVEHLQQDMIYNEGRLSIKKNLVGDTIVHLPTQDLLPLGSKNYAHIKRGLKSLREKTITIQGKDELGDYEVNSGLIMKSKFYMYNHMVEIQLDHDLLPSYLALAKNYSRYLLEVAFNSSSSYVMKLYQFISHWKDKTRKTVMLDELRDFLQLETKYEKPKDLRKWILEPAAKELKERADVWFELKEPIKVGRSIVGYVFQLYKRSNTIEEKRLSEAHTQNIKNVLTEMFQLSTHHLKQLEKLLNSSEMHSHIYTKLQEIASHIQKGKVQKVQAYVLTALKNEFNTFFEDTDTT